MVGFNGLFFLLSYKVDKNIYKGNVDGWSKIWATEGGLAGI